MTLLLLRAIERMHGHAGWLAVAALAHPALTLRHRRRRARLSAVAGAAMVVLAALLGAITYPAYREQIKPLLFAEHPWVALVFERKEHLGVGAVVFALVGALAHLGAPHVLEPAVSRRLARLAHEAFVIAFVLSLVVASMGVLVSTFRTF